MGNGITRLRRFSNLQWYLAHSQNRVHLACASREAISQEAFHALLSKVLALAPQLGWAETLLDDGLIEADAVAPEHVAQYECAARQGLRLADLAPQLAKPLADTGRPAFRALCRAAPEPDARGLRSWLLLEASHALIEGGDVAPLLHGLPSQEDVRPLVDLRPRRLQRLAAGVLMPLLAALHLGASALPRPDVASFRFGRVALERAAISAVARRMQVTQRALLFGLVLEALFGGRGRWGRRLNVAYSSLPQVRALLIDDSFLKVRMDELRLRTGEKAEATIAATAAAIAARGPSPLAVQAWHSALLGWQRRLWRRVPWLFQHGLFGYSPYHIVLSLVPWVRAGKMIPGASEGICFAASMTGTTPNCIYAVGARHITLSLWLPPVLYARLGNVAAVARALQIDAEIWE